jgi:predicted AAA+ superfamily ATPase
MAFIRSLVDELVTACRRKPALIQVIAGPRQVGKTTAAEQLRDRLKWPSVWAAADLPLPPGPEWIETQWQLARELQPGADKKVLRGTVLPVLLGSSALLVQKGLTESLAGRFFLHRAPHWSWPECRAAFRWTWQQWVYFGGYPGAAAFARNERLWKRYVADSLIETVLSRDVLQMQTITKPALLRHLFALAATYPAQML